MMARALSAALKTSRCINYQSQYGAVHIIDVEQRTKSKIIIWGTVDDGHEWRSFECVYGAKITAFKLRSIPRRRP